MSHMGFGHFWLQPELSDVDIVLKVGCDNERLDPAGSADSADAADAPQQLLQQFPGHKLILSSSAYFAAQVVRRPSIDSVSHSSIPGFSAQQARQQISITLPNASYKPAAMAVLAALYFVLPLQVEKALAELTQQQLLQAAVLAHLWEVPGVCSTAVQALTAAANSTDGLDAATTDELLAMTALPDSLRPLLRQALLGKFGDLEAALADEGLNEALMDLPLHAMELLLSLSDLKVASEDTVLYTAQAYVDNLLATGLASADLQLEQSKLAALVRFPYLSHLWRAVSALSDKAREQLLGGLRPQLQQLLLFQTTAGTQPTAADPGVNVPSAPPSWLLPPRVCKQVSSVQVEWAVDMSEIKAAAQQTASSQATRLASRSPHTAPLMGIGWRAECACLWDNTDVNDQGVVVGVFATPTNLPFGAVCKVNFWLECVSVPRQYALAHSFKAGQIIWGWCDFFDVRPMSGAFDGVAWAAKGLPTSGQLVFRLTVKPVGPGSSTSASEESSLLA